MLVLDTHVLIWAYKGIRIPKKVERQIDRAGSKQELFVSAITPWEIALGVKRERIRVAGDVLEWIHGALEALAVAVASLEPSIAVDSVNLPAWDHADPSDCIIVATARKLEAQLVTGDSVIIDYAVETKAVRVVEI